MISLKNPTCLGEKSPGSNIMKVSECLDVHTQHSGGFWKENFRSYSSDRYADERLVKMPIFWCVNTIKSFMFAEVVSLERYWGVYGVVKSPKMSKHQQWMCKISKWKYIYMKLNFQWPV